MDNPPPLPTPYHLPHAPNWWQRNWPWAAPVGCVALLAFMTVFIGGFMLAVFGAMKSSDAYKTVVQRAKTNEQVINALGSPVKEGRFLSGNVNVYGGGSGNANLVIPISGPRNKGMLYAVAIKSGGMWTYSTLRMKVDGTDSTINLLEPAR